MRLESEKASPRRGDDSRVKTLLAAISLVAVAWAIYRPDRLRPFHFIVFSEFVPILLQGDGVADNTRRVVEYYASQGRFNVIPYVLLAVKWDLFSWWTPGWQIARAVLMVTLSGLTYLLLRRLGASRLGGLVGGSVYLWSPAAADGWVRMTIAEPLGAAIMMLLSIRAVQFQRVEGWQREIVWMAVGTMALIWTKELMAPLVLLPLGLALTRQPDGRFVFPRPTRRNTILVVAVVTAAVLALIPITLFYLRAEEAAYASMYGRGMQSPSGLLAIWVTMLVPFLLIVVPANVAWALAVGGLVLLVAVGWRIGFRAVDGTNRARWLLAFALFVPLAGLLAYLPNPWYATFYTLPYLIGSALLIGMGATWLQETGRKGEFLAVGAWMGILLHGATSSATYATRTDAVQRRDERVVSYVADSVRADSVQFATRTRPAYDWLGFGAAMSRIARAKGHPWPPTRNISCADAREHLTSRRGMLTVNFESSCRFEAPTLKVISQEFRRLDLRRFQLVVDSAHADLVLPAAAKGPR